MSSYKSTHNACFPFDVLLTSYDIALMDKDFLSQTPWKYEIIDEAQRLKKIVELNDSSKVKERLQILRSVLAVVMLRRTKSRLMEYGSLVLPLCAKTTVLVTCQPAKRVHMSILRKELPKLVALSSGTSNYQSL